MDDDLYYMNLCLEAGSSRDMSTDGVFNLLSVRKWDVGGGGADNNELDMLFGG